MVAPAHAGNIRLVWDASPGAIGYEIHYGLSSQNYTNSVRAGNVVSFDLEGLADCTEWFIAVRAQFPDGVRSEFSREISGWTRPRTDQFSPNAVEQGQTRLLQLTGGSFSPGTEFRLQVQRVPKDKDGLPLIHLADATVTGCGNAELLLTTEPGARGQRAMETGVMSAFLEVLSPEGLFSVRRFPLEIVLDEARFDINRSTAQTLDRVDGSDLAWLSFAYGSDEVEARFNADADLDGDGLVDGWDLALLSAVFGHCFDGETWSDSYCNTMAR